MSNKEPMVWEAIVNDDARQAEINARHRAECERQVKLQELRRKGMLHRMYEVAAKDVIVALVFFVASALAVEVGIIWAGWLSGVIGVIAMLVAAFNLGKVQAAK